MHHLHHIGQRRLLAHGSAEQLLLARIEQPVLHQLLGCRAQGLATHGAAAHDLHKVAQHLAVVDHAAKHLAQQRGIPDSQRGSQGGWHVLHIAALAGIDGRLGCKARVHFQYQIAQLLQLILVACIESLAQAAGHGHLGQLVAGAQGIGCGAFPIDRVGGCSQCTAAGLKQLRVDHSSSPVCIQLADALVIASGVPTSRRWSG